MGSDDLSYLLCRLPGSCHLKLYLGTANCGSLVQISDDNTEIKILKVRNGAKIRNQNNQATHRWESDNFTIRHHKREPRGQPFTSK